MLALRPQEALWRRLYFYDTPGLDLYARGVVLRARATTGAPDDSTVKIRPVDPALGQWLDVVRRAERATTTGLIPLPSLDLEGAAS